MSVLLFSRACLLTQELSYLSALLAKRRSRPSEEVVALLGTAVEAHFATVKGLPLGAAYYLALNPDFVLQVVKDYLDFAPNQVLAASYCVLYDVP